MKTNLDVARVIVELKSEMARLRATLVNSGGCDTTLANQIDRLDFAIAALAGELNCPYCDCQLTSGR